jgi:glutamate-ammonia-ligase adenylyltransferase
MALCSAAPWWRPSRRRTRIAPEIGWGLIVLAMGKMGAGELNYSSDIDLIVFFDRHATSLDPISSRKLFFVRLTQECRGYAAAHREGVFRVDLRWPDLPRRRWRSTVALHYYEREGRTWERAASDQRAMRR